MQIRVTDSTSSRHEWRVEITSSEVAATEKKMVCFHHRMIVSKTECETGILERPRRSRIVLQGVWLDIRHTRLFNGPLSRDVEEALDPAQVFSVNRVRVHE